MHRILLATLLALSAQAPKTDTELQREIIAKLSGAQEIRAGVTLANRATLENRQEARTYLLAVLSSFGLEAKRHSYGTAGGENIYAVLSSGRPGAETIVIGAHYDSVLRAPGANDNASGVAAVSAIARAMASVKGRTRDLIIAFFDEEERGLTGSRAFAQWLKDENRNVIGVHTIDQAAWDQDKDRAIEIELPYDGALALYEQAVKSLGVNIPLYTTTESGSDHSAFRRLGFPAVGVTEEYRHQDTTPHIHKETDKFETIDFDYLASTTKLVAEVIKGLITSR